MITLGLAASLIDTTIKFDNVHFIYATLAVAAAALTLISVPTMYTYFNPAGLLRSGPPFTRLVLDMLRPGSPSSWIVTELSILRESLDTPRFSLLTYTVSLLVHPLAIHRGQHGRNGPSALISLPRRLHKRPLLRYLPRNRNRRVPENFCDRSLRISELDHLYAPSSGILPVLQLTTVFSVMGYSVMVLVLALIAVNRKQQGVWKSSVAELPSSTPAGSYGGQPMQPAMHSTSGSYGGQHMEPAYGGTAGSVQAGAVHSV